MLPVTEIDRYPIDALPERRFLIWRRKLHNRLRQTRARDSQFWRMAASGPLVASSLAACLVAAGMPTGLGLGVDGLFFIGVNLLAQLLTALIIAGLLALFAVPLPRYYTGLNVYSAAVAAVIMHMSKIQWPIVIVLTSAYVLAGIALGMLVAIWTSLKWPRSWRLALLLIVLAMGAGASVMAAVGSRDHQHTGGTTPPTDLALLSELVASPGESGAYAWTTFTYGSGVDRHRDEFAEAVDLRAQPVDASAYIEEWPRMRTWFWGFDQTALPLNGRVWMPQGEGRFPLVLIVHGNSLMERFSDDGYGYLGELLASRGMIAVSVDENFLNYSHWSGIPKRDMLVRAWILLQHLQQISAFDRQSDTPFFAKVERERVGMIGHSRGGQAVAMAADHSRWFAEDPSLANLDVSVRAVAALAPTDTRVDDERAVLQDQYYLTLQGASDADITNFYGDRQYARAWFSEESEAFKASLYIADANHSQFNVAWGSLDLKFPEGLFLNRADLMDDAEQRQIAKVYLAAFMETALNEQTVYTDLFRDYRTALDWLPQSDYISRFESGTFREVTRFADRDLQMPNPGVIADADGATEWRIEATTDRAGNKKGRNALLLAWDEAASYTLYLTERLRRDGLIEREDRLAFSMADVPPSNETDTDGWELPTDIIVEVESKQGEVAQVVLSGLHDLKESITTSFTALPWLSEYMKKRAFREPSEAVFQTYEVPLSAFSEQNPQLQPEEIYRVTFHFIGGSGRVLMEDIGFMSTTHDDGSS